MFDKITEKQYWCDDDECDCLRDVVKATRSEITLWCNHIIKRCPNCLNRSKSMDPRSCRICKEILCDFCETDHYFKKHVKKRVPVRYIVQIKCDRLNKVLTGYDECDKCDHFVYLNRCVHDNMPREIFCSYDPENGTDDDNKGE